MRSILDAIPSFRVNTLPFYSMPFNQYKFDIIKLIDTVSFKYATVVSVIHQIACHAIIDSTDSSDQEKSRMYKGSFVVINGIAALISYARGTSLATIGVSSVAALIGSLFFEMAYQSMNSDEEDYEEMSQSQETDDSKSAEETESEGLSEAENSSNKKDEKGKKS